jgi:hypothetical protein
VRPDLEWNTAVESRYSHRTVAKLKSMQPGPAANRFLQEHQNNRAMLLLFQHWEPPCVASDRQRAAVFREKPTATNCDKPPSAGQSLTQMSTCPIGKCAVL